VLTLVRNAGVVTLERCTAFKLRSSDDREIVVRVEHIDRGRLVVDGEIH